MALTECVECGGKVSTRAEVCPHCGCPVEPPTPQINCPDCGEDFTVSLEACPHCGAPREEVPVLESSGAHSGSEQLESFEEHYWNGKLASKGTMKNGLPHGSCEQYFRNGQLNIRETYKNGWLHGPYVQYFKNGQLFNKGYWVALGDTETEAPPDDLWDGSVPHGPWETYNEDGSVEAIGTHNMGEPCGEWQQTRPWPDHEELETKIYPPCDPGLEGED